MVKKTFSKLKEVLGKIGYFCISSKFKNLRIMIISILMVSLLTVGFTLKLVDDYNSNTNFFSNKEFGVETLKVYSSKPYQVNNTLVSLSQIYIKTTKPCKLSLLFDNIRGKEVRNLDIDNFETEHRINVSFVKGEILRPFVLSGRAIDKRGNEIKIPDYDFIPGHSNMDIVLN